MPRSDFITLLPRERGIDQRAMAAEERTPLESPQSLPLWPFGCEPGPPSRTKPSDLKACKLLNLVTVLAHARYSVVVRWTIGDVSDFGYETLAWSIAGAWQIFGDAAEYVVCVHSMPVERARERVGSVAPLVHWRESAAGEIPPFLRRRLDGAFAEGVGWKFAPLHIGGGRELALDNDCILWDMPQAVRRWLDADDENLSVIAEDVRACFGQFAALCGHAPRNSGVRGTMRGSLLWKSIERVLAECPVSLRSELDEQGLQVAALHRSTQPLVVTTSEVTICSPFSPHQPYLGTCGAHFVGLNARALPWSLNGRPASQLTHDNWRRLEPRIAERIAR